MRRFLAKLVVAVGLIAGLCTLDPGAARQGQNNLGGLNRLGHGGTGLGRLGTDNVKRVNPSPPSGSFSVGIDLVGAQAQFPTFATTAQINYHANRLHGSLNPTPKFRFAIGWSQTNNDQQFNPNNHLVGIQPVAFGALDTTSTVYNGPAGNGTSYVAQMNHVISDVMVAGGQVLIDIHTFGGGPGGDVGSGACPFSCFADLWGKIADYYVHTRPDLLPGIYGFDLMNEWGFIDSAIAFNGNQAAITSSRANGYTGRIYYEGVNFTSAWNWTSGQGQSFDNSNLYQLVDPLNNLLPSSHMYPDPDDSGSVNPQSFAYSVAIATAGSAPTGLNVNPTIGVTRTSREFQPWTVQHSLRPHIGEFGTSNDNPWRGGAFDYADWNIITRNLLTYLQANNIEINLWASGNGPAGYGPNGYAYSLDPFNVDLSGNYDFTATGVQEPIWAVLDVFTGYAGAQPTAYALFQPGLVTPALYTTVGSPSQPFTIYYGGKITSPVTITPHDTLADFTTGAGGTFTPATITLTAGDNALATFTYTPSQAATIAISTTNNRGWSDPPRIGISSTTDNFATLPNTSNICDLRRVKTTYIGPAVREIAADGVSQQDFYFNNRGDLPRQALYDYAASTTPKIVRIYSQNGNPASDCIPLNFSSGGFYTPGLGNPPLLNLNPTGYPEVSVASTQWMGTQSASNGQGLLTLISRVNGTSVFLSQSNFNTQFRMATTSGFDVAPNAPDSFVSFGAVPGYNNLAGTYSNLYGTNNQKAYVNGSVVGQASPGQFTFAPAASDTFINGFRFGGQNFVGAWTSQIITFDEASSGVVSAFNSSDVAYYSTPLPDTFVTGNLPPVVSNTPAAQTTVLAHFFPPFGMGPNGATNTGTVVTDPNPGGTDSAVITITGDAGATITGSGITGSNPYTIASTTPATLTSVLQLLQYQSSSSVGTVGTISLIVTSSSTHFATVNTTVTVGAVVAETAFAAPVGCTFTPPTYAKGVNISDGQITYPADGTPNRTRFNYIYPQAAELSYFASQGMTAIRFPTTAPRLQPFPYRPFDPPAITRVQDGFVGRVDEQAVNAFASVGTQTNLTAIKALLDQACSLNIYVLLEPHDFGGIFDTRIGTSRMIGVDAEGTAMSRDWWTRFSTLWKNYPNAVFQEMNEPTGMTATQWQTAAALITSDIAAVTTSHIVMVQGVHFDGCLDWVTDGSGAAWAAYSPPAGLSVVYECHQYLDSGNSGQSPVCAGTGSSRMTDFNNWLIANSRQGFVGEFGWSAQASCMTSATTGDGPTFLAFLSANDAHYFGWTWWLGGSSAFEGTWQAPAAALASTIVPVGYPSGPFTPAPQLQTLINNLP